MGMGKDLYDAFPSVKQLYEELDDTLSQNLTKLIFEGPLDVLSQTENTQPAIVAVSLATLKLLEESGIRVANVSFVMGHSLGEYAALCAAGVLSFSDTMRLLRARGRAMQEAVPLGQGGMVALVGADLEQAEDIAQKASAAGVCEVANDNCPGQVVISGAAAAMAEAIKIASDMGIKRALPLNVSAPFHSSMMRSAEDQMREVLQSVQFLDATVSVIPNLTAQPEKRGDILRNLLIAQITGRVRWRESIMYLHQNGVQHMLEVGPGKVLSGLVKRTVGEDICTSINTPADIESVATAFIKEN